MARSNRRVSRGRRSRGTVSSSRKTRGSLSRTTRDSISSGSADSRKHPGSRQCPRRRASRGHRRDTSRRPRDLPGGSSPDGASSPRLTVRPGKADRHGSRTMLPSRHGSRNGSPGPPGTRCSPDSSRSARSPSSPPPCPRRTSRQRRPRTAPRRRATLHLRRRAAPHPQRRHRHPPRPARLRARPLLPLARR